LNAHGGTGRMDFESETFLTEHYGVRRLMPLECERLQGFPDGWTQRGGWGPFSWEQSDGTRYRQLGNAVCVNVAEWLGHRISTYLR
jgi:DNA (cytosine-5)-methyltransferase 1